MAASLPNAKVGAIIVAAGESSRMGSAGDKTLADLAGEPLIARTVDAFERCEAVACVALVVSERNRDAVTALREAKGWRKTLPPIPGGARRQDSVRAGLKALPEDCGWIVVHDGARPFVTSALIEAGLEAAHPIGAAVAVVPAFDTVKRVAPDGSVAETLDRAELRMAQTPQVFRRDVLDRAHAEVADDATDDAAMAERVGVEVWTFAGDRGNIKVTTAEDLGVVELLEGMSVARTIRELHNHEVVTVNNALRQAGNGLQTAPRTDNDLNKAWELLGVKTFNGLLGAMLLLDYGYYDQSMTLIRSSEECMLTAQHAETHNETVEKVLQGLPVRFHKMAADTGQADQWSEIYKILSNFAHPSGARAQARLSPEGMPMLPMGSGAYDELRVVAILQAITDQTLELLGLIQALMTRFGGGFPAGAAAARQELQALKAYIREHYPQYFAHSE